MVLKAANRSAIQSLWHAFALEGTVEHLENPESSDGNAQQENQSEKTSGLPFGYLTYSYRIYGPFIEVYLLKMVIYL